MKQNLKNTFSTRNLVLMAVLIAIQIVLARYLSVQVHEGLRISFETIPLALAGMWLGPLPGVLVALFSDFLGVVIYGYGVYFPPISLGPMVFALICGLSTKYVFRSSLSENRDAWKVVLTVVVASIVNTYGIGLLTTTWYQMLFANKEGTFAVLAAANFIQRLTTKPLTIAVVAVAVVLVNRAAYKPVVSKIVGRAA